MKKFLAILLSSMMLLAAAGCSGENTPPATPVAPSVTPGESAPITISYVNKNASPDDARVVEAFKRISEGVKKTKGYDITFDIVSIQSGTYSESLSLLLQSGKIPDIIYFQGGDYQFAMEQNILENLLPYVEKSELVKAAMEPHNMERLKNYPYLLFLAPATNRVPVVRGDWFAKTASGAKLIADPSVENYYNFFTEIKQAGGATSAITSSGNLDNLDAIFDGAFGNTTEWIKGTDGKYTNYRVSENEKNKMAFYQKLYKDGLLDTEYTTKKWDTVEKAFYDGHTAIIAGGYGRTLNLYNTKMVGQNGTEAELMLLPPAKGVAQNFAPLNVSKEDRGMAISAYSQNKEAAFAVLEYMTTTEGMMLDKLGFEGEHYTIANDKITLTDKFPAWNKIFWDSINGFTPTNPIDEATPLMCAAAMDSFNHFQKYSTTSNSFTIPVELTPYLDGCNAKYAEFAADVITGKRSIDDFDKFTADWYASGGTQITEYANTILK